MVPKKSPQNGHLYVEWVALHMCLNARKIGSVPADVPRVDYDTVLDLFQVHFKVRVELLVRIIDGNARVVEDKVGIKRKRSDQRYVCQSWDRPLPGLEFFHSDTVTPNIFFAKADSVRNKKKKKRAKQRAKTPARSSSSAAAAGSSGTGSDSDSEADSFGSDRDLDPVDRCLEINRLG